MSILLVCAILIPSFLLFQRGETQTLILAGVIVALLSFFTILLKRRQLKEGSELWGRTLTFWWMTAAFLVAVTAHPAVCYLFFSVFCGFGLYEFLALSGVSPYFSLLPLAVLGGLTYALPSDFWVIYGQVQLLSLSVLLVSACATILSDRTSGTVRALGSLALGQVFFVSALGHGFFLLGLGAMTLVLVLFLTEIRDLISYWVGKALAHRPSRKIAPSISPHKAWSVGLLAAVLVGLLGGLFAPIFPRFPGGQMSREIAALVGFAIGLAGLMGDLLFSMIKRDVGLKDSRAIDRMDSLVLTLPVAYHLIRGFYG